MTLPLSVNDISEWLAFVTVILLVTAEVVSHFGPARGLLVDKSRLRILAVTTGLIVLGIIALQTVTKLIG